METATDSECKVIEKPPLDDGLETGTIKETKIDTSIDDNFLMKDSSSVEPPCQEESISSSLETSLPTEEMAVSEVTSQEDTNTISNESEAQKTNESALQLCHLNESTSSQLQDVSSHEDQAVNVQEAHDVSIQKEQDANVQKDQNVSVQEEQEGEKNVSVHEKQEGEKNVSVQEEQEGEKNVGVQEEQKGEKNVSVQEEQDAAVPEEQTKGEQNSDTQEEGKTESNLKKFYENESVSVVGDDQNLAGSTSEAASTIINTEQDIVDSCGVQMVFEGSGIVNETSSTNDSENVQPVEYQFVLNQQIAGRVSINGLDVIDKENSQAILSISECTPTMSSESVTEVTLTDVEIVEASGVTGDAPEQVVVLPLQSIEESSECVAESEDVQPSDNAERKDVKKGKLSKKDIDINMKKELEQANTNIPCHVLGRNIDNPLVDTVKNGRVLLRPRLGVKIPHRNLTSQIVSKQEIAEEIMERSRLRQSNAELPMGGDILFTKKLTHRLAKKIISAGENSTKNSNSTDINKPSTNVKPSTSKNVEETPPTKKIIDNSDLIALLEGDDVPDWNETPMLRIKKPDKPLIREKEIALQQLKDLPKHSGSKTSNNKEKIPEAEQPLKKPSIDDLPPRFSTSTPLKTYTRKRRIEDLKPPASLTSSPSKPIPPIKEDDVSTKSDLLDSAKEKKASRKTYGKTPKKSEEIVEKKSEEKVEKKSEEKSEKKSEEKSQKKSEEKSEKKSEEKSQKKSEEKSEKKSEEKSQKKSEEKSEKKSEEKSQKKSEEKNEKKSEEKSQKKSEEKSQKIEKTLEETSFKNHVEKLPKPVEKKSPKKLREKSKSLEAESVTTKPSNNEMTNKLNSGNQKLQKKSNNEQNSTLTDSGTPCKDLNVSVEKSSPQKTQKSPKRPLVESQENPPTDGVNILSPNTYISKSSRIVKKKKIWDPDEIIPSATFLKSPKPTEVAKSGEKKVYKTNSEMSPARTRFVTKKLGVKKTIVHVKKKSNRFSELDKLLMDEGAVKLLYSVKNADDSQNVVKTKRKNTMISLDKAERELKNKANEIRNNLLIAPKHSPIALRKKGGVILKPPSVKDVAASVAHRKKSKDSASGSVHSPPASPGFGYSDAGASRIIRRHSSSSFSSDATDGDVEKKKAEPQKKKLKVSNKGLTMEDKQNLNEEMSKNFNQITTNDTFSIRKIDNLTQIILAPTSSNGQMTLSDQVMEDLSTSIGLLDKDDNCRAVLISSSGDSFCLGIDYKELVSTDEEVTEKYAKSVSNFLSSLANFSKVLVAGVNGNTVGLGVTMLPLFDMVLASDTATFSVPYAKLGCTGEGSSLFTIPNIVSNSLASELFFASRKLTAAEALRLGLVTRTLWPNKFQDEMVSISKLIANQSLQSMKAIKKQLKHHTLLNIQQSLESEKSILIKHWLSEECQNNFRHYSLEELK